MHFCQTTRPITKFGTLTLFYDFFKTISGDEVEKLRIDTIVTHCSGLSC